MVAPTASAAGSAVCDVLCRGDRVVGYYALAMSSVAHAGAPSRLRRGMPDPVSVVLLAPLALDRTEQRKARGGRELGARALIVDAIDDQASAFYRRFDFDELDDRRLWRRLADVTRAVGE